MSGELGLVKLRWKQPEGDSSELAEIPIKAEPHPFAEASSDARFCAAVAAFGLELRHSKYLLEAGFDRIHRWAREAIEDDPGGYRAQFLTLVQQASELQRSSLDK